MAAIVLIVACGPTGTSQSLPVTTSALSSDAPSPSQSPSLTPGGATLFTREGVTTCLRTANLPVETESGIIAAGVQGIAVLTAGGGRTAEAVVFIFASTDEAEAAGLAAGFDGEVRANAFVLWGNPSEQVRSAVDDCVPGALEPVSEPTPAASLTRSPPATVGPLGPPDSTPLADPPSQPAGDGTTATISTEVGDIVIELFNESSPVAAQNFINLTEKGYYDGVIFHRVIPGFVIQGGDPDGTGRGGPGYTIPDDAVVGEYVRGILAMARPANPDGSILPDSAGSQFFIVLDDLRQRLPKEGGYQIFGRVTSGMEVVDAIAAAPTDPENDRPLDPVTMTAVTITRP